MIHTIKLWVGSFAFAFLVLLACIAYGEVATTFIVGMKYGDTPLFTVGGVLRLIIFVALLVHVWFKGNSKESKK